MNQEWISVIVPVCQWDRELPWCMDSLLAQNCEKIEIILVDDGSREETESVLGEYTSRHPAIRVIHNSHGSVSAARLMGAAQAKGDWIAFAEGETVPDLFGHLTKTVRHSDADLVCWGDRVSLTNSLFRKELFAGLEDSGELGEGRLERILSEKAERPVFRNGQPERMGQEEPGPEQLDPNKMKQKTLSGFLWSFAEKIGVQLVSFVVSILLARLLVPDDYGIVAIVWVFISLAQVFVRKGLGMALIQKKDADSLDFASVFWVSLVMSLGLYGLLYVGAPPLARWYGMPLLSPVLRVMGLRLVFLAFNSVQIAKVSRDMDFKKFFYSTLSGTVLSAVVGIAMAWKGFGVWALVAQEMVNILAGTIVMLFTIDWHPELRFSAARMKSLFSYGWKVQAASLLDALYENFQSLYVGKIYPARELAFYNRGKQFPQLVVDNVNASVETVMFPVISAVQDDREALKQTTRQTMKISSYIATPVLVGIAAVAEPLVTVLMTEKWLPCVPFLQVLCMDYALTPLQYANQQAVYAVGRSDINLKLNVLKKVYGFLAILIFTRVSILALCWAVLSTGVFTLLINMLPNRKLLNYGVLEQFRDILPNWLLSGTMFLLVRLVALLQLPEALELLAMILVGISSYVLLSVVFRVDSFRYLWKIVYPWISKIRKK